jgi:hypothetical protein
MPYKLVCCSISALEPSGSASQKALLELLRLFNHRLRSSAPLGAPFACFTGTKAQQLTPHLWVLHSLALLVQKHNN